MARILMVEDDPEQASLFAQVLRARGYEVETVNDAQAAVTSLAKDNFDLALVDWDLPGIQGHAFIIMLKVECPFIKSVLFSNHEDVAHAAIICGADGWLHKREGIQRLQQVVGELL